MAAVSLFAVLVLHLPHAQIALNIVTLSLWQEDVENVAEAVKELAGRRNLARTLALSRPTNASPAETAGPSALCAVEDNDELNLDLGKKKKKKKKDLDLGALDLVRDAALGLCTFLLASMTTCEIYVVLAMQDAGAGGEAPAPAAAAPEGDDMEMSLDLDLSKKKKKKKKVSEGERSPRVGAELTA